MNAGTPLNLLPNDGLVRHFGPVLSPEESTKIRDRLLATMPWAHDELVMFGKRVVTSRKVAWFGDPGLSYTYSGSTKRPLGWIPPLTELRELVERLSGSIFNSCLLNLYHRGSEGMGWHSDDESSIVADSCIASLSFGAQRRFSFRHKRTKERVDVMLEHGSLLLMEGETQRHWQHCLPKSAKVSEPRINLTFRRMRDR